MKIGLLGAPGAGKTELAKALAKRLEGDGKKVAIVDEYIEKAEKDADLAMGFYATYIGNILAAMSRFSNERTAEGDVVITCGTLIENQLYAATDGINSERFQDDADEHRKRVVVGMQLFGLFMMDLFDYDALFYLPLEGGEGYVKTFDENIPLALELWDLKAIKLEGTADEQVEAVITAIKEKNESKSAD